jgi:fluoride ion exporter CrcB/FEX
VSLGLILIGGMTGGLIRSMVGILKSIRQGRKLSARYFTATIFLSALLGVIAGLFVANDFRFSILAGYAGSDFLEGLYKVEFGKRYRKWHPYK